MGILLRLLSFLIIILCSKQAMAQGKAIPWSENRKLTWADFQGRPDRSVTYFATTKYGVQLSSEDDGEGNVSVRVVCLFDKRASWKKGKSNQSEYLLKHEQNHFDIGEIFTRRMRKEFKEYTSKRHRPSDVSMDIRRIFRKYSKLAAEMQRKYDAETDHSINEEAQKKWDEKVSKLLHRYREYAMD